MSKSEQSLRVPTVAGGVVEIPSPLSCVRVDPNGPLQRLVVGLHGYGDSAPNFSSLAQELRLPGTFWVIPEAPTPLPFAMAGGSQWFPLFSEFHKDLESSVSLVVNLLESLQTASGLNWNQISVFGFSQGASVTLNTVCRLNQTLGGALCLSGFFAGGHRIREVGNLARQTPFFLGHGLQDNVVLPTMHFETLDALNHFGFEKVVSRTYTCGHTLHPQELRDIEAFVVKGSL